MPIYPNSASVMNLSQMMDANQGAFKRMGVDFNGTMAAGVQKAMADEGVGEDMWRRRQASALANEAYQRAMVQSQLLAMPEAQALQGLEVLGQLAQSSMQPQIGPDGQITGFTMDPRVQAAMQQYYNRLGVGVPGAGGVGGAAATGGAGGGGTGAPAATAEKPQASFTRSLLHGAGRGAGFGVGAGLTGMALGPMTKSPWITLPAMGLVGMIGQDLAGTAANAIDPEYATIEPNRLAELGGMFATGGPLAKGFSSAGKTLLPKIAKGLGFSRGAASAAPAATAAPAPMAPAPAAASTGTATGSATMPPGGIPMGAPTATTGFTPAGAAMSGGPIPPPINVATPAAGMTMAGPTAAPFPTATPAGGFGMGGFVPPSAATAMPTPAPIIPPVPGAAIPTPAAMTPVAPAVNPMAAAAKAPRAAATKKAPAKPKKHIAKQDTLPF